MDNTVLLSKLESYIKSNDFSNIENTINLLHDNKYGSDTFYTDTANRIVRKNLQSPYVVFKECLLTSKRILTNVKDKELTKYKFVNGKINDYLDIVLRSKEENDLYFYFIRKGKKYYREKDLKYSLYIFMLGYHITKRDIFLYYAGKIRYKMGEYDDSLFLLNKYNETGSIRYLKSNLYIMSIHAKRGEKHKNNDIFNSINELFLYDNFKIEAYKLIKKNYDKKKEYKRK